MSLFIITLVVYRFSYFYMGGDTLFSYFSMWYFFFFFSMMMLLLSKSPISVLLFWELLGVSSFFLINYYGSVSGGVDALIVALTMRFGDFFLILSCVYLASSYSPLYAPLPLLFLSLAILTKSAQYPFMGWLTRAMSAPTPVSALVHSSTLVVSGVMVMYILNLSTEELAPIFLPLSLLSLALSGVSALFEEDYKKIVALSTLSQISFSLIMFFFASFYTYLHLISHAFTKSLLFMLLGFMIYSMLGQQDSRLVSCRISNHLHAFLFVSCLFALCGIFYSSSVISKEVLLDNFRSSSYSWLFFLFFYFGVYMTFMYSFRLWFGANAYFGSFSSSSLTPYFLASTLPLFILVLGISSLMLFNWWVVEIFPSVEGFSFMSYFLLLFPLFFYTSRWLFLLLLSERFCQFLFDLIFRMFFLSNWVEIFFSKIFFDLFSSIYLARLVVTKTYSESLPFASVALALWWIL